jgi:hypothetical protein
LRFTSEGADVTVGDEHSRECSPLSWPESSNPGTKEKTMTTEPLSKMGMQALVYVHNTGGNATRAHFDDDHEPIGPKLWEAIYSRGLVTFNQDRKIVLTEAGKVLLRERK